MTYFKFCSYTLFDTWKDSPDSVLSIYQKLIEGGLRIWVYRYAGIGILNLADTHCPTAWFFSLLQVKIWLYDIFLVYWKCCSGDIDARVSVILTGYCMDQLKLPIKRAWQPRFHEQHTTIFYTFFTSSFSKIWQYLL